MQIQTSKEDASLWDKNGGIAAFREILRNAWEAHRTLSITPSLLACCSRRWHTADSVCSFWTDDMNYYPQISAHITIETQLQNNNFSQNCKLFSGNRGKWMKSIFVSSTFGHSQCTLCCNNASIVNWSYHSLPAIYVVAFGIDPCSRWQTFQSNRWSALYYTVGVNHSVCKLSALHLIPSYKNTWPPHRCI
jgi:hypothetical protein